MHLWADTGFATICLLSGWIERSGTLVQARDAERQTRLYWVTCIFRLLRDGFVGASPVYTILKRQNKNIGKYPGPCSSGLEFVSLVSLASVLIGQV
ncbi:hypothetical protein BDW72DRAFT_148263 [Aspergillus terricola var. indicus]